MSPCIETNLIIVTQLLYLQYLGYMYIYRPRYIQDVKKVPNAKTYLREKFFHCGNGLLSFRFQHLVTPLLFFNTSVIVFETFCTVLILYESFGYGLLAWCFHQSSMNFRSAVAFEKQTFGYWALIFKSKRCFSFWTHFFSSIFSWFSLTHFQETAVFISQSLSSSDL